MELLTNAGINNEIVLEVLGSLLSSRSRRTGPTDADIDNFLATSLPLIATLPSEARYQFLLGISHIFRLKLFEAYIRICKQLATPAIDFENSDDLFALLSFEKEGFFSASDGVVFGTADQLKPMISSYLNMAPSHTHTTPPTALPVIKQTAAVPIEWPDTEYLLTECDNLDIHPFMYVRRNYVQPPLREAWKAPKEFTMPTLIDSRIHGPMAFEKPHPYYNNNAFPNPKLSVLPNSQSDSIETQMLYAKQPIAALHPICDYTGFVATPALLASIFSRSYLLGQSPEASSMPLINALRFVLYVPSLNVCIDSRYFGSEARFVSFTASKDKVNAFIKQVYIKSRLHIQIHATRDIQAGEAIYLSADNSWLLPTYYKAAIDSFWMDNSVVFKATETIPYTSTHIWEHIAAKPCIKLNPVVCNASSGRISIISDKKITDFLETPCNKIDTAQLPSVLKGFTNPPGPTDLINESRPFSILYETSDFDALEREIRYQTKSYVVSRKKQAMKRHTVFVRQPSMSDVDFDQLQQEIRQAIKQHFSYIVQEFYSGRGLPTGFVAIKAPNISLNQFSFRIREKETFCSDIDLNRTTPVPNSHGNRALSWSNDPIYPSHDTEVAAKEAHWSRSFVPQSLPPPRGYYSKVLDNTFNDSPAHTSLTKRIESASLMPIHFFNILESTMTPNECDCEIWEKMRR